MKNFTKAFLAGSLLVAGIPAFAATVYTTTLAGSNEVPPVASVGTGMSTVTLDGNSLAVDLSFSGLGTATVMGHIHCCSGVGVNSPVAIPFMAAAGFPLGVTSGTYSQTFALDSASSYMAGFITANGGSVASAQAAFLAGLNSGQTYVNVHTTANPGGEIRGQLSAVPEPSAMLLGGGALAALAILRRRRLV